MTWQDITITIVAIAVLGLALFISLGSTHPADACQEDGAWVAVDHHALDAIEDSSGVSRACRNIDDLIDTAIEVAIQNGSLKITP